MASRSGATTLCPITMTKMSIIVVNRVSKKLTVSLSNNSRFWPKVRSAICSMKLPDKNKENQILKSFDVLALGLCFFVILYVCGPIIQKGLHLDRQIFAKDEIGRLSEKLLESAELKKMERNPALVADEVGSKKILAQGEIEKDPWGKPYQYFLLKAGPEMGPRLVIVSGGPNRIVDTASVSIEKENQIQFADDDLGLVSSIGDTP